MKNQQIRWLGAAILMPLLIGLGTASCEDTSIWDVNSMVGSKKSECKADIDCDDKNECTEDTCNAAGLCEYLVLPNAKSCDDGDVCTVDRCDIYGRCQNDVDTSIVFSTDNPCVLISCEFGAADPAKPLPNGAPCETDTIPLGAGYCYQATCYSCKDGLKNGDETGIDCGGANCPSCSTGQSCNQDNECLSGYCVDGVCCNSACDTVCYSCNLPGAVGTCAPVALLDTDINPDPLMDCADPYRCDGNGACRGLVDVGCASDTECLTNFCYANLGVCKQNVPGPCLISSECHTGICSGNSCSYIPLDQPCVYNDQCGPDRFCYTTPTAPICKVQETKPCAAPSECATGFCSQTCMKAPNFAACTYSDQCQSGYCYTTPTVPFCALDYGADCSSVPAIACRTGYCDNVFKKCEKKPPGLSCTYNDQCQSDNCSGMPLLCQP